MRHDKIGTETLVLRQVGNHDCQSGLGGATLALAGLALAGLALATRVVAKTTKIVLSSRNVVCGKATIKNRV